MSLHWKLLLGCVVNGTLPPRRTTGMERGVARLQVRSELSGRLVHMTYNGKTKGASPSDAVRRPPRTDNRVSERMQKGVSRSSCDTTPLDKGELILHTLELLITLQNAYRSIL